MDLSKAPRGLGKILYGAFQHRSHTQPVSRGIVVEGHGHLDQSLAKLLVFGRGGAPNVFEDFVSVKELRAVEETYSANQVVASHASFLHTSVSVEDGPPGPSRRAGTPGLHLKLCKSKSYLPKNTKWPLVAMKKSKGTDRKKFVRDARNA
jgi:hypothetical protein